MHSFCEALPAMVLIGYLCLQACSLTLLCSSFSQLLDKASAGRICENSYGQTI